MSGRAHALVNRYRSLLVAALLLVPTALGTAPAASDTGGGHAPDPRAPHRGTVKTARTPDRSPGRDRAVRAFAEGRAAGRRADADLTHNWWGVFPQPGTHDGITATHGVDTSYRVSDPDNFTYAPTTKAENSCMEVVTAYWNSGNELWAWDWCGSPGGPAKVVKIDADFLATYSAAYGVQLVRDDAASNTWSAYLYNRRTGTWELLHRNSGRDRSGLSHGWDMFEIYASVNPATGVGWYCTEARRTAFDSSAIQLRKGGAWRPAGPAEAPWTDPDPQGRDFLCPGLKFVRAGANDHWTVRQ